MEEELVRRVAALETDVALLKTLLLETRTLKELEVPIVQGQQVPLKMPEPILMNKSWQNLKTRCIEAEKRGKVDEVANDAINGDRTDRV